MKLATWLWAGGAVYFVVIAIIYASLGGDRAGVAILVATAAFGGLLAGWLWRRESIDGSRIDDHPNADVGDDLDEMIVAEASLRPLGVGAGMTILAIGFPLGSWMVATGIALLASQIGLMIRDRDT